MTAVYNLDSEVYELAPAEVGARAFLGADHRLVWSEGSGVIAHDLRTGETRELLSTAPDLAKWPRLGPDGKTLYFVQRSASSDIHLLVAEEQN